MALTKTEGTEPVKTAAPNPVPGPPKTAGPETTNTAGPAPAVDKKVKDKDKKSKNEVKEPEKK
jgi:hypothetical protein